MKETHVATNASQTEASPEARHVFSLFVDFYFCVKKSFIHFSNIWIRFQLQRPLL